MLMEISRFFFTFYKYFTLVLGLVVQEEDGSGIIWPEGGVIQGEDGLTLIVPSGATSEPIPVTITALQESDLGTPVPPNTTFLGGAYIDLGENELSIHADLSMPAPDGVPDGAEVYLAKLVEYAGKQIYQLVDTAVVENGIIISQSPAFPGIIITGMYSFLLTPTVGWIQGSVYNINTAMPVPDAVVTLSGSYWLDIADEHGSYRLPAWAGNFVVNAFDRNTGEFGEKQGFMPYKGATVTVNIDIGQALPSPVNETLINGNFETGDLTGWELDGAGGVISSFGPINPYEGNFMGIITTGYGALGGASSVLKQSFIVPQEATKLSVRYNFVSEEYPHWVGSSYNDVMRITLHTPDGSREFGFEDVNNADFKPVYGIPDYVDGIYIGSGDGSWGKTGWLEASIDVSQWAGTEDTLTITVHDVGDTIFDSIVLVDDISLEIDRLIDVPYIHQIYHSLDNFNGDWACGAVSAVMILAYYKRLDPSPEWVSYKGGRWSDFGKYISEEYTRFGITWNLVTDAGNNRKGAGAWGFIHFSDGFAKADHTKQFFEGHGLNAYLNYNPTEEAVKREIDKGNPVWASTSLTPDGHIVVITGYVDNGLYIINDPWGDPAIYTANQYQYGPVESGKSARVTWSDMGVGSKWIVTTSATD